MEIGVLGGTFDPVHLGHLIIAERAREEVGLDKVIFVPAGIPPHRQEAEVSAEHRYRMVALAAQRNPDFLASDVEINRDGPSYTYDTIQFFLNNYGKEVRIHLILGADAFQEVGSWYKIKELVPLVSFVVVPREGAIISENLPLAINFQFLNVGIFSVSAREIRQRIKAGRSIRYLVPDLVREYIGQYGLYK
ncbi:MAG: nicotinate-nucleotide adenylyltransferase [Candidatus Omnitrophota bacterium]